MCAFVLSCGLERRRRTHPWNLCRSPWSYEREGLGRESRKKTITPLRYRFLSVTSRYQKARVFSFIWVGQSWATRGEPQLQTVMEVFMAGFRKDKKRRDIYLLFGPGGYLSSTFQSRRRSNHDQFHHNFAMLFSIREQHHSLGLESGKTISVGICLYESEHTSMRTATWNLYSPKTACYTYCLGHNKLL